MLPRESRFIRDYSQLITLKPAAKPSNSDAMREEILGLASTVAGEMAEVIPETNFWALAGYTVVIPELLSALTSYALPQSKALGSSWNLIDAACQGITGLQQLFDKATHRPIVTKAKGLLNFASNIQLLTLTLLSTSTLGPLGFAAGTGVSFLLSVEESIRQMRKLYSPEYFLVDGLAELDKVESLLKEKRQSLASLEALSAKDQRSKTCKLARKLVHSALTNLETRRDTLKLQLQVKVDRDRYESHAAHQVSHLDQIVANYREATLKNPECRDYLNKLRIARRLTAEEYKTVKKTDDATNKETKLGVINAVSDSVIWCLAFTGMLLVCIPGMQAQATALITAASLLFLLKNSKKIVQKMQQIHRFFKKAAPPEAPENTLEKGEQAKAAPTTGSK